MEQDIIQKLIRDKSKLVKIYTPDKVYVGDAPIMYVKNIGYWAGKKNYKSSNIDELILLPTYSTVMGEFFVFVMNNMYYNLTLDARTLIWFYKIHDEYGLPAEIFKVFGEINFAQIKALDILAELAKISYEGILFQSDNIIALERNVKEWLNENFDMDIINHNALVLGKVRTFICHLLKTFNFGHIIEADILKSLVNVICTCDKQTDSPLTEKCINDLLACVQWHNVSKDIVGEVIELLTACPNFKLNNTITNGIKKRENLAEKYDKKEKKKFKYEKGFCLRDCFSNIKYVHSGYGQATLYTTTIDPVVINLVVGIFPNNRDDNTKSIVIRNKEEDLALQINITVEYQSAEQLVEGSRRWVFNGFNKLFINIPNDVDNKTIKIIFNEVVCIEKTEKKTKIIAIEDRPGEFARYLRRFYDSDSDDDVGGF